MSTFTSPESGIFSARIAYINDRGAVVVGTYEDGKPYSHYAPGLTLDKASPDESVGIQYTQDESGEECMIVWRDGQPCSEPQRTVEAITGQGAARARQIGQLVLPFSGSLSIAGR